MTMTGDGRRNTMALSVLPRLTLARVAGYRRHQGPAGALSAGSRYLAKPAFLSLREKSSLDGSSATGSQPSSTENCSFPVFKSASLERLTKYLKHRVSRNALKSLISGSVT
ncbi:hypothetical protein CEP88_09990 [Roseobacter denitrificans]|nr:hypothetical protein CEP88_09990 [Roseobacter denitrificans]